MHSVYDQFFHHEHSDEVSIDVETQKHTVKSFFDAQRNGFQQLISAQRTLVENASLEPSLWWFNSNFSATRYGIFVQQQIDMLRMFHNIDAAVSVIYDIHHLIPLFS